MSDDKKQETTTETKPDNKDQVIAELQKRLDALEATKKTQPEDKDLLTKAKETKESEDKKSGSAKQLEAAIRFSLGAEAWLKTNQTLLPKDIADIFKASEKENFESPVEKDAAIKSGIIQSFFAVQSNLDLLTASQKNQLEEYLKLTKTGKQDKAQQIYDMLFEPTFEMLKRVKKAEAIQKGHGTTDDDSYKLRMMELSKKHYLGAQ
jgi:hypothetical protein